MWLYQKYPNKLAKKSDEKSLLGAVGFSLKFRTLKRTVKI